ncbi:hypothetical protein [Devosia sp.]|uniref:hypothetical protein n=1 Tax=Devosia sp. TaxID=1871048 RepID=UPI003A90A2F4
MPTLIRLFIVLLVLAGLAYGAMVALVATVEPREKLETIRIPTRELVPQPSRDPLVRREIDTSRTAPEPTPAPAAQPIPPADTSAADEEGVVTLQPGIE